MQGAEAGLLLAICAVICVICAYTKEYAAAFVLFFFGDFLAIQGKIHFGYQALGVYKELTLLALCIVLLIHTRQSLAARVFRALVVLFACTILAISTDYRPFSALILAGMLGVLVGESGGRIRPPIMALCVLSIAVCTYQFLSVTDFSELWFYDFLSEKAGDEFLATYNAYFRNDRLRPPGFLVSPSTFGFIFVLFSYLAEKHDLRIVQKLIIKVLCLAGLLMIQTRALLIIFVAFETQQYFMPAMRARNVLLYYMLVLTLTLVGTVLFGDEGSLVRILLFTGLFSDLAAGVGWLPFASENTGPVDSQFVSYVRAFGVLSILHLFYLVWLVKRQCVFSHYKVKSIELAFLWVLLFINVFQWSESSPGNLLGWLMLGYYFQRNKKSINLASRRNASSCHHLAENGSNSIRASI